MERIHIDHDSGYLDLNIEAFFPCSLQKARKVFKLINRCCPYGDRAALRAELLELAKGYEAMCQMYEDKISTLPPGSKEIKPWAAELRKTVTLRKRLRRNIDLLEV